MVSTIIFALSLSIDAFGYSFGFGSRNVRLRPIEFLVLNLLNVLILWLFFEIYSFSELAILHNFLESIGNYLLLGFGFYYIFLALKSQLFDLKTQDKCKIEIKNSEFSHLTLLDLALLLSIFVIENILATIIFCVSFTGKYVFLIFIFLFHMLFFLLGFFMGNKIVSFCKIDSSLLSGVIFVVLALFNF